MARVGTGLIVDCQRSLTLWDEGIGYVLLSRQLSPHQIAFSLFLVDVWCLGVKDICYGVLLPNEYEQDVVMRLSKLVMIDVEPAEVRKLVEGSVAYAKSLGLPPHSKYREAAKIFGNIDSSECGVEFEFGEGGKPCFCRGPYADERSKSACAAELGR